MSDTPPNRPDFSAAADSTGGPLDMRPAVDAIVSRIHAQRAETGKPVVVMLLEAHDKAAHIMLSQLVMERLRSEDPSLRIAHGLERSHNLLDRSKGIAGSTLSSADADGTQLLNHLLVERRQAAPVSRRNLMEYCGANNIPIRAIDAAGSPDGDGNLDQSDPATRAVIQTHAPELLDTQIDGVSGEGIHLRNLVAVDRVQTHINDTGADVYILPYGAAHGHGWKQSEELGIAGFPVETSLDPLFRQHGITPLIVLPDFTVKNIVAHTMLPDNADLSNTIILDNIPNTSFWQKTDNTPQANAELEVAEARFLQQVSQQSGGTLQLFPRALATLGGAPATPSSSPPTPPPI